MFEFLCHVTLKLAVSRSRPSVPYGANVFVDSNVRTYGRMLVDTEDRSVLYTERSSGRQVETGRQGSWRVRPSRDRWFEVRLTSETISDIRTCCSFTRRSRHTERSPSFSSCTFHLRVTSLNSCRLSLLARRAVSTAHAPGGRAAGSVKPCPH